MKTILFIEDESALQKSLGEMLKKSNFRFISAFDGETGLDLARKRNPDLILLDLILPKLDGFKVLEALKKDKKTNKIPIIILTNLENPFDVQRALELGATTYLIKANYELDEIVKKIKEIVS